MAKNTNAHNAPAGMPKNTYAVQRYRCTCHGAPYHVLYAKGHTGLGWPQQFAATRNGVAQMLRAVIALRRFGYTPHRVNP